MAAHSLSSKFQAWLMKLEFYARILHIHALSTISLQTKMDNQVLGYKDLAAIPKDKAILDIERPDLMIYEPHFTYSLLEHVELPRSREVRSGGSSQTDLGEGLPQPQQVGGRIAFCAFFPGGHTPQPERELCAGIKQ